MTRHLPPQSEFREAYDRLSRPHSGSFDLSRRQFLAGSIAAGGLASVPGWIPDAASAGVPLGVDDTILVAVMLGGGADYLDTVVPFGQAAYSAYRGNMAIPGSEVTAVAEGKYLNSRLGRMADRFRAGQVAIVEGVGEATDDHSHFTAMASRLAGKSSGAPNSGWLGRWVDQTSLDALGAVAIGDRGIPLHLQGASVGATALPTVGDLYGGDRSLRWERDTIDALVALGGDTIGAGPYGDLANQTSGNALALAAQIEPLYAGATSAGLVRDMEIAADLINLDLGCRVLSVAQDGYDTHANQGPVLAGLYTELDLAIETFFSRLTPFLKPRVTVLLFTEFGRRAERNGSAGTDHGTASFMALIGNRVKGGFHGQAPSLTSLDSRRDLQHTVDYRAVYSSVVDQWLGGSSASVIGQTYPGLDLFRQAGPGGFYDVESHQFFGPAVGWLATTGITSGTAPGQFSPGEFVTREQMAVFLWNLKGKQSAPSFGFTDVPTNGWSTPAIDWLARTGITQGTSIGKFSPGQVLNRAQMATFLWRMEGEQSAPPSNFKDVPRGSFFYKAVSWLVASGVTSGWTVDTFAPDRPIDRAQMATFLWRLQGEPAV